MEENRAAATYQMASATIDRNSNGQDGRRRQHGGTLPSFFTKITCYPVAKDPTVAEILSCYFGHDRSSPDEIFRCLTPAVLPFPAAAFSANNEDVGLTLQDVNYKTIGPARPTDAPSLCDFVSSRSLGVTN